MIDLIFLIAVVILTVSMCGYLFLETLKESKHVNMFLVENKKKRTNADNIYFHIKVTSEFGSKHNLLATEEQFRDMEERAAKNLEDLKNA